jgi:hypothetical protein
VWLFSSGPLGTEPADAKGRDLRTVTVPKEIPEFTEALHIIGRDRVVPAARLARPRADQGPTGKILHREVQPPQDLLP